MEKEVMHSQQEDKLYVVMAVEKLDDGVHERIAAVAAFSTREQAIEYIMSSMLKSRVIHTFKSKSLLRPYYTTWVNELPLNPSLI
jgi:hypothetical protein